MEDGEEDAGKQRKEKCLWMLRNLPDCLQMWLEMEAEGEGLAGRPVLPLSRRIGCLFSKWGKDAQANREAATDFSAGRFEGFSQQRRPRLPVWVSPHMWHAAGKGLKASPSLSRCSF